MGFKLAHEYTSLSKMGGWAVNVVHLVEYLGPLHEVLGSRTAGTGCGGVYL